MAGEGSTSTEDAEQKGFNLVYILSLPAFVWFKANDTSGPAKYGHTCENLGHGQMAIIGGLDPSNNFITGARFPDPNPQGLGIFNMVNLSWANSYDATIESYSAPDAVKEWYNKP